MPNSQELCGRFKELPELKGVFKPFVRVEFFNDAATTDEVDAIFDSGAFGIIVEISFASLFLGIDVDKIKKFRPYVTVSGVGSKDQLYAYRFKANVRLRATSGSNETVVWNDTFIWASEGSVPYGVLIGQLGGLQERTLFHLNYPNQKQERCWKIMRKSPVIRL